MPTKTKTETASAAPEVRADIIAILKGADAYEANRAAFETVGAEVEKAYADCHSRNDADWQHGMERRALMFRASAEVTREEAKEIMAAYVPGYNQFTPELIDKLPDGSRVTIAREYSVCLYVRLPADYDGMTTTLQNEILADECDLSEPGVLRLWWD